MEVLVVRPANVAVHFHRDQKGRIFMRQLHIREPWADLAYNSGNQLLEDLASRVQMLESRVRELEFKLAEIQEEEREAVPAGV
jgi:hypothetical protein